MRQSAGDDCQNRGRQVRGFKWIKQQGKVHGDESTWRRDGGREGHQGKKVQENQQVGIVGVMIYNLGKMDRKLT